MKNPCFLDVFLGLPYLRRSFLVKFGPVLVNFGQLLVKFGQLWSGFANLCPCMDLST